MRVVGGTFRGRPIEAPKGRDTRPTTDRMREGIASMILSAQGLDLSDCVVLDAFAGSGGMGIELLSRGARACVFCERDRRAAAVIRRNCESVGLDAGSWRLVCGDALRLGPAGRLGNEPFSVVFLDPPYAMGADRVSELVEGLQAASCLAPGCLVVYERAAARPELEVAALRLVRTKAHGSTSIDLLRMEG